MWHKHGIILGLIPLFFAFSLCHCSIEQFCLIAACIWTSWNSKFSPQQSFGLKNLSIPWKESPVQHQGWKAKLFGNLDTDTKPKPVWLPHSCLVNALKTSATEVDFCLFVWICCNVLLVNFCSVCGISTLGPVLNFGQSCLMLLCVTDFYQEMIFSPTHHCKKLSTDLREGVRMPWPSLCPCKSHKVESGRKCRCHQRVLPVGSQFCWL